MMIEIVREISPSHSPEKNFAQPFRKKFSAIPPKKIFCRHKSNSAWESQGIELVKENVEKHLELLFLNPFLNMMNLFFMNTESFHGMSKNYLFFKVWWWTMVRVARTNWANYW